MSKVEIIFPEVANVPFFWKSNENNFTFSEIFHQYYSEEIVYVLMARGDIENFENPMLFTDFTIGPDGLSLSLSEDIFTFPLGDQAKFFIRTMQYTDTFPDVFNRRLHSNRQYCIALCFQDDNGKIKNLGLILCPFQRIYPKINSLLERTNVTEIEIGQFRGDSQKVAYLLPDQWSSSEAYRVMTIYIKTSRPRNDNYEIVLQNEVTRKVMSYAMRSLKSNQSNKLARRLAIISRNSGVPLDLLARMVPGFKACLMERISLPLNRFSEFTTALSQSLLIRACLWNLKHLINDDSSEADLRSLAWDRLLTDLLICERRENTHLNFSLQSELGILSTKKTWVDFTATSNSFDTPFLIVEIGKERPKPYQDHKDFSKLLSLCSHACHKLCLEAIQKGKDPRTIKVFGIWVGASQFRFCVAHPVFTVNRLRRRTEIAVHLSFAKEWRFDLLQVLQTNNCDLDCCNGSESDDLKAIVLEGSTNAIIPFITETGVDTINLNAPPNLDFIEDEPIPVIETGDEIAATIRGATPFSREIDFEALGKLKVFLECALSTCDDIESLPNNTFEFDFEPIAQSYIPTASSKSNYETPQGRRIRSIEEQTSPLGQRQTRLRPSTNMELFEISKRKSYESQFYLSLGPQKLLFPLLISLECSETDPNKEIFVFERMSPLFTDSDTYGPFIRTEHIFIESLIVAVHTLYELLVLHEYLGYVHSDISPNNIMFSVIGRIWKLNDFNQSRPIQESLEISRTAGTYNYVDPEAQRTGIFTRASDVYSLGQVLGVDFYYYKLFHIFESNGPHSRAIEEFKNICLDMVATYPDSRISVRTALKRFYDLLTEIQIPADFDLYGKDSIFPLVEKEIFFTTGEQPISKQIQIQKIPISKETIQSSSEQQTPSSEFAPNIDVSQSRTHQGITF